jgi:hypothetical protein
MYGRKTRRYSLTTVNLTNNNLDKLSKVGKNGSFDK